ncbi:MAG: laccase domain-containing protein [Planctomycetes bacterium]|nr:laccase domain-containing protein [Planctomycetota bacterium]
MRWIEFEGRRGLVFEQISAELRLPHVFTSKGPGGGGNLSLSGGRSAPEALLERDLWSRYLAVNPEHWVVGWQTHGNHVAVVSSQERGRGARCPQTVLPNTDGLLTAQSQVPLYVAGADCGTVLIAVGGSHPGIATVHAGWRGAASGILGRAVQQLRELTASSDEQIYAGVAPCIGLASFEVGEEVAEHVPLPWKTKFGSRWHVDLEGWLAGQLLEAGVPQNQIELSAMDTMAENHQFFSHRGDGAHTGRQGLIAVLP